MMTNTVNCPLRQQTTIRIMPRPRRVEQEALRRARRRKALWNTVLEALATLCLSAGMIFCAVMLLYVF